MSNTSITYTVFAATGLIAVLAAWLFTPLSIRFARAWRVVDQPDARKVHNDARPRLGGLAIMASATVALLAGMVALWLLDLSPMVAQSGRAVSLILVVGLGLGLVGLADDLWDLRGTVKLLWIILTGLSIYALGYGFTAQQIVTRFWTVELTWLAPMLTVLWVAFVVTALNFIDGLDGLSAGIAAIAALVLGTLGIAAEDPALALGALALGGACIGFLRFNLWPSRTFMGDGGSMFLGGMLAALTLRSTSRTGVAVGWLLPAAALSIPLLDTVLTVVRRGLILRCPLFLAERGHIHHMLLDRDIPHHHVVAILHMVSLAMVAAVALSLALPSATLTFFGLLICGAGLLLLFRLSGSPRLREITAAWRKRKQEKRGVREQSVTEAGLAIRFKRVRSFDGWWKVLVASIQELGGDKVKLAYLNRAGEAQQRVWQREDDAPLSQSNASLETRMAMADRRVGEPVRLELSLPMTEQADEAAERLATLTRLITRHPLASIDPQFSRPAQTSPSLGVRILKDGIRTTLRHHRIRPSASARDTLPPAGPSHAPPGTRIAIVHDFLYTYAGAERVLEQMVELYPDADLFSLFDFLPDDKRDFIRNKPVATSFLQRMPLARSKHRAYLMLMPLAAEQLDVSDYDIVISSSYVAAKGIITRPDQLHVCYCHSPVRFAWDLQHQYLSASKIKGGPKAWLVYALRFSTSGNGTPGRPTASIGSSATPTSLVAAF